MLASDLMIAATNTLLIPGQEIVRTLDDPHLACITDGEWKTNPHNAHQLCIAITDWRLHRRLVQDALPFLNPEEREFLQTGLTPKIWAKVFPPPSPTTDPF